MLFEAHPDEVGRRARRRDGRRTGKTHNLRFDTDTQHTTTMLFKMIAASLLVSSSEALNLGGGMSRRAALAKAASVAAPLVAMPAFAELQRAGDAEIYARADAGKLNAARAIERAKTGDLANGASATCAELDALIEVDREAIEFENDKVDARFGNDKNKVQATSDKLQNQVDKLKKIRKEKGCSTSGTNLKQGSDFEVYKRADEGVLNSARVIERAKAGKLVDGSGASCSELEKIIKVDKKAMQFEKDKLEAMGSKADAKDKKTVDEAEKAIEAQIQKLAALQKSKGC